MDVGKEDLKPFNEVDMVSGVQVITNSPEAIRRILRGLNLRDLLRCKRVCKSWKFYAEKILNERQRVRTLLVRKREKSNWMAIGSVKEVEEFFKELDIRSDFVLLFGKLPLSRPCVGGNDLFSLKELLPNNATIIGAMSSAGIMGTDSTNGKYDAFQSPRLECVSCMVFPNIDGLAVRYFHLSLERYEQESFSPETANLEALFGIPATDRVKCLMLISPSYMPFEVAQDVFGAFWLRERGAVALCGGILEDVIELGPGAREIRELGLTGIAFCGDDRVSAGSIVIPPQARTKPKVQNVLRQYPPLPPVQSSMTSGKSVRFGIVFSCAGRGSHMFKDSAVEMELLQAQFPETPFAGVFSMGECGVTFWPPPKSSRNNGNADEEQLSLDQLPNVIHSYSTTIAIISINGR